jgi:hypothetical protein
MAYDGLIPEVCIPTVSRAMLMTLLATTGTSINVRLSSTRPLDRDVVSSIGASAVTKIDSDTAPTSSRTETSIFVPTESTMPLRITLLNPGASVITS